MIVEYFKIVCERDFDRFFLITFPIDDKSLILIGILSWVTK